MAANGVDLGFGSALRVQQDTMMLAREDATSIARAADERVRGFDIRSSNARAEAKAARSRASGAIVGSIFDASKSILGGATQYTKWRAG
nr:hypothetical protein [Sphingomonas turrisvirgatae]